MVLPMLFAKQDKNAARDWPDWRTMDPNKAIEHVRTPEELAVQARAVDMLRAADKKPGKGRPGKGSKTKG
jgi:hypothetical protein